MQLQIFNYIFHIVDSLLFTQIIFTAAIPFNISFKAVCYTIDCLSAARYSFSAFTC